MRTSRIAWGTLLGSLLLAGACGSHTGPKFTDGGGDVLFTPDMPALPDAPRPDAPRPDASLPDVPTTFDSRLPDTLAADTLRTDAYLPDGRPDVAEPPDAGNCTPACTSSQLCVLGVCYPIFCTPGDEACIGNAVSTCNATGTGRAAVDCGAGMACVASGATATCLPIVCTPGVTCAGSSLVECDPTGTTQTTVDCAGMGGTCVPAPSGTSATCAPTVCTPGATSCSGGVLIACDSTGTVQTPMPCAGGQTCIDTGSGASCQPITCTPSASFCVTGGILSCDATGTTSMTTPCPVGSTCVVGSTGPACSPVICTSGATSCSGTTLVTCNFTGTGTTTTDCTGSGGVCVSGGGGASCQSVVCTAGTTSCSGNTLVTCNATGTGNNSTDCTASGQQCVMSGGSASCQTIVCIPGTVTCVGSSLVTCNAAGTATMVTPCGSGNACVSSGGGASCVPTICTPGASLCVGNTLEVCNSTGTAFGLLPCGGTAMCLTSGGSSSCQPIICTAGAKSCASDGLTVLQCNAAGTGFTSLGPCDTTIGQSCTGAGLCTGSCALIASQKGNVGCEFWPVNLWNSGNGQFGVVVTNPSKTQTSTVTMTDKSGTNMKTVVVPAGGLQTITFAKGTLRLLGRDDGANAPDEPAVCPGGSTCNETYSQMNLPGGGGTPPAFHLTSSIPIAAYQFNPFNDSTIHSGTAALLLPQQSITGNYLYLGREMEIVEGLSPPLGADNMVIVGTVAGTTVTVTLPAGTGTQPSIAGKTGAAVAAIAAGGTAVFTLNQFDTLELTTKDTEGADLSGASVTATSPVVVYSTSGGTTLTGGACASAATCPAGNSCSAITPAGNVCASLGGDHFETQLYPEETWDTDYFLVKTMPRVVTTAKAGGACATDAQCAIGLSCNGGSCIDSDYYRVLAEEDGTTFTTSDPAIVIPTLNKGQFFEFSTSRALLVHGSHPILVHQFIQPWGDFTSSGAVDLATYAVAPTNGCNEGWPNVRCIGDANMMPAVPKGQMRSEYIFYLAQVLGSGKPSYTFQFVDIVAPLGTTFNFDAGAVTVPALTKIGSSTFGFARIELANTGGTHTVTATRPFAIQVYGYDSYVSYGYPGGLNLNPIAVGK